MAINVPVRKVEVDILTCQRCEYEWQPKIPIERVRVCPRCKSVRWDVVPGKDES